MENLLSEFQATSTQLDRYILMHQATLASVERILSSAQAAHASGNSWVEVATVDMARTLLGPTFDARTGTMDGLLTSGRMGVLQSEDLRRTLSAWPGLLADAAEEEKRSLDLILNQMGPALHTRMDLSPARTLAVEITEEACNNLLWGRSCEDINVEVELPARWVGTSSMPVNLEVLDLFSIRMHILTHGLVQLEPVRKEIDLILAQVEESLGG